MRVRSRDPEKINSKGRVCNDCGIFKPWDQYYKDRKTNWGHVTTCIPCHRKQRQNDRKFVAKNTNGEPVLTLNGVENKSLRFLLALSNLKKNSWTYSQAKQLLDGLELETNKGNFDFDSIYKQYMPTKKVKACNMMRMELTKAAENGMTLKSYWKKGRPYSQWAQQNRIIVPGED